MTRNRRRDLYRGWAGTLAHPNSPAGGAGFGYARLPELYDVHISGLPHPNSPAGRTISHIDIIRFDALERAECLTEAVLRAQSLAASYVVRDTGVAIHELIDGIVPTLLFGLGVLGLTTGAGATGGAALGSLGGGIGALPGAMIGASAGVEAGLAVLNALGVGFLFIYISDKLPEVCTLARSGVKLAWDAPERSPGMDDAAIDEAAHHIAKAVAILVTLILQGIVLYLTAKGARSSRERLPELVGKLNGSKMGRGFAMWVERNYSELLSNSKLTGGRRTTAATGGPPTDRKTGSGHWRNNFEETIKADAGSRGDPEHFRRIYDAVEIRRRAAIEKRELTVREKQIVQEARGELNSFFKVNLGKEFQDYNQIHSFGKGKPQGFDDVFEDSNGNILIVESKAGSSSLGEYPDVGKQMSYEWIVDRAKRLGSPVGDKILNALNNPNGRVQGVILRTPKESGAAVVIETRPSQVQGIKDINPETGIIDYSATHRR